METVKVECEYCGGTGLAGRGMFVNNQGERNECPECDRGKTTIRYTPFRGIRRENGVEFVYLLEYGEYRRKILYRKFIQGGT